MNPEVELIAQALPRYEIRGEIGRGGWGVVYEGWHRDLKRPVAIKQLPRAFGADPEVRDRFIAEAQLVASLEHPHIVPVYDFAERDGLYLIVMEYASGGTIWQKFRDHGLHADQAVGAVLATAVGLHHAHSQGLLHRDVKPDNVLYSASGVPKIADFGIAKSLGETQAGRTATKSIIGTPAYMAPEQITGGPLSASTDVYALGIVLYELLSGHLPFPAVNDTMAQLWQHVNEPPRSLLEVAPTVPIPLANVAHRAMQKDPSERPESAEVFAVELATAATAAFGLGWLHKSGQNVMGSTAVIAATERLTGPASRPSASVLVRPDDVEHARLGQMQSGPGRSAQPATVATGASGATVAPGAVRPSASKLKAAVAMGVAVVALAIVAFVVFSGGDGGSQTPLGPDTASITAAEELAFQTACESQGVSSGLCECAKGRAIEQLDAQAFRSNLAVMLEPEGELLPALTALFDVCVADGF